MRVADKIKHGMGVRDCKPRYRQPCSGRRLERLAVELSDRLALGYENELAGVKEVFRKGHTLDF
jgi:hypothetical protein